MGTQNADWTLRGAVSTDLTDCAVPWNCVDITERTRNVGERTFTYCGVGKNATLLAVAPAQKTAGTGTMVGPDEEVLDIVEEFEISNSSLYFDLVHCEGEIRHYSDVYIGNRSSQNALTASGPDATAAAVIDSVSFQFGRITRIRKPEDTPISQYVTNVGYNEDAPLLGSVDGVNTAFEMEFTPLLPYPVAVFVDGAETIAFTVTGKTVTTDVAPACGEVLTVSYYDERFAIYGTTPLAVMFCGQGGCSTSDMPCEDVYALYESTTAADPDTCGNISGNIAAIGRWRFRKGALTLVEVKTYANIVGPEDAACSTAGDTIVIADSGIYEGGFNGFGQVNPSMLPAGAAYKKVVYDNEQAVAYALFNTSGILRRDVSGAWAVVVSSDSLTTNVQYALAAESGTVLSGGTNNSVQISTSGGQTWKAISGPASATATLVAADVGPTSDPSDSATLIGVLATDTITGSTSFYVTGDNGLVWSAPRKSWSTIPADEPTVSIFEDWLVYVQIGDETWRNANRGCDKLGAWQELLDSGYETSAFAYCADDPNALAVFAGPAEGALSMRGSMSGVLSTIDTFDVLANVYTDLCPAATYTLTVDDFRFGSGLSTIGDIDVVVNADMLDITILADPGPIAAGEVLYVRYNAETSCGSDISGVLIVDIT